jgi:hypothetical protein
MAEFADAVDQATPSTRPSVLPGVTELHDGLRSTSGTPAARRLCDATSTSRQLSRRANARRLHPAEVVHRRRVGVFTCPDHATHVEGAQPMSDEERAELDGRRVQTLRARAGLN